MDSLKSGEDEDVDIEAKYAITSVFAECGGLEVRDSCLLKRAYI